MVSIFVMVIMLVMMVIMAIGVITMVVVMFDNMVSWMVIVGIPMCMFGVMVFNGMWIKEVIVCTMLMGAISYIVVYFVVWFSVNWDMNWSMSNSVAVTSRMTVLYCSVAFYFSISNSQKGNKSDKGLKKRKK